MFTTKTQLRRSALHRSLLRSLSRIVSFVYKQLVLTGQAITSKIFIMVKKINHLYLQQHYSTTLPLIVIFE